MQRDIAVCESSELTIADMARLCGVGLRTLRFYEQVDLLKPRRVGTLRLYSTKDRIRVELILTGKRIGFSLREIRDMLQSHQSQPADLVETLDVDTIQRQIKSLERQKADIEAAITELRAVATSSEFR